MAPAVIGAIIQLYTRARANLFILFYSFFYITTSTTTRASHFKSCPVKVVLKQFVIGCLKKKERYLSCFEARLSDGNNGLTKSGPNHEKKQKTGEVIFCSSGPNRRDINTLALLTDTTLRVPKSTSFVFFSSLI